MSQITFLVFLSNFSFTPENQLLNIYKQRRKHKAAKSKTERFEEKSHTVSRYLERAKMNV